MKQQHPAPKPSVQTLTIDAWLVLFLDNIWSTLCK